MDCDVPLPVMVEHPVVAAKTAATAIKDRDFLIEFFIDFSLKLKQTPLPESPAKNSKPLFRAYSSWLRSSLIEIFLETLI
jgi:hypothetical protein